ncbi:MAG: methionine ABC transporter ATP-binding protein [Acholeplasma sp.]|nr:methionine ABC transporter ATP-binding protein [Acholeplasma sp.]
MIVLDEVVKEYDDIRVINKTDLVINDREVVGIVGYSGAGKSTLVRLINGLVNPTSGKVKIDGIDINSVSKKELNKIRHEIGMIFQNYNLLSSLTVYDNVKLALKIAKKKSDYSYIEEVLTMVGLKDKINEYPKNLSGGEKQRVAIARAIVNNPKYLLCDEITSALDNKTAIEIVELLKDIKTKMGITIVFISHQLEIVRKICDRVVVMEKGSLVEDAEISEFFLNPKSIASKSLLTGVLDFKEEENENLYVLKYRDSANQEMILSEAIKKFGIDINLLKAQTIDIKNKVLGFLLLEIFGSKKAEAIKFFASKGIEVEKYEVYRD